MRLFHLMSSNTELSLVTYMLRSGKVKLYKFLLILN